MTAIEALETALGIATDKDKTSVDESLRKKAEGYSSFFTVHIDGFCGLGTTWEKALADAVTRRNAGLAEKLAEAKRMLEVFGK